MGIEGFNLYQVPPWMLEKLKQSCHLWYMFISAEHISNSEDWDEVKWYFRRGSVLESESQEDILRVLAEGKLPKLSLKLDWGLLHFYLRVDWQDCNHEWQHRNQFEDSGHRLLLFPNASTNNLLLVDAFTTGMYMPFDIYVSYYTFSEVQQLREALAAVFKEDFESRLDKIQQLGKDVTIYRGNQDYYFNQYFNEFSEFYKNAVTVEKSVILQAIC